MLVIRNLLGDLVEVGMLCAFLCAIACFAHL